MVSLNPIMSLHPRRRATAGVLALAALAAAALPASSPAVTGVLTETHGDRLDGTETPGAYSVVSALGTVRLAAPQPEALVGHTVAVDEHRRTRAAVAAPDLAAAPAPGGPQSLLVVLVALPDAPAQTITPEVARAAVFTDPTSSTALFAQQSGGAVTFGGRMRGDGDVAGPYALPVSAAGCSVDDIADAADRAAATAGWTPGAYDHVLYVLPRLPDCDWAGLGQMPGRRAWTNGYLDTRVIAHELGHNLGAHHASSLRCVDANGAPVALSASCSAGEYGDPFDVMGLPARLMSSWHRAQISELGADHQRTATQSETYPLTSADAIGATGTQLLLVPRKQPGRPVTSYLAVERRSPLAPFDGFDASDPVVSGLTLRVVPPLSVITQSQLIDTTPETSSVLDAPLQPGRTFADTAGGIAITAGPDGSAHVTMPAFVDDVPPSAPPATWLSATGVVVHVHWLPSSDDVGLARYEVERDGATVGDVPADATAFDDAVTGPGTVRYRVIAIDTSGNRAAGDAVAISVPASVGATGGPVVSLHPPSTMHRLGTPRLASNRMRRVHGGWAFTLRVTAAHATKMSALIGGRRVASAKASTLPVRFRFPDRARRRTVVVRASNAAGSASVTWAWSVGT
jgi:hypothetical protein